MSKQLTRSSVLLPSAFDDFFRPWKNWFYNGIINRMLTVPAVKISVEKEKFSLSIAVPGKKKKELKI